MEVVGQYVEPLQLQVVARTHANQALLALYEQVIREVTQQVAVQEEKLRDWFERNLITPAGTRGTVFREQRETAGLPNATIDMLEQFHLIRAEARAGARWYELIHDRLIRPIQLSNQQWRENAKPRGWRRLLGLLGHW